MTVDTDQFEKWIEQFAGQYPVLALDSAEIAFQETGTFLLGEIPEYPPESLSPLLPPDGVAWLRTEQQRKWFFAAVRSDKLPGWKWVDGHPQKVGGARRGNLSRGQVSSVTREEASVQLALGFDPAVAPHAPWVVGDDYPGEIIGATQKYQARIHVDRWWQFRVIISSNEERGWSIFIEKFWEEFSKRIGQTGH